MEKQQKNHDLLGLALSDSFEVSANSRTHVQQQKSKPVIIKAGQKIKQYSIISKLGEGGMGVVYKAFDQNLQREVAIKILCNNENHFHKLLKEAKSIAQLNHPNIVQVYEVCDKYPYFFAMELINGISLAAFIQLHSKKLKKQDYYRKVTNIFILVARALEFAHSKGIIHRDLKPENIMLDRELQPKVMDFGIARVASDVKKTLEDDNFAGTPMYMSPEQAKGSRITKSTDIYSLGVTLYESLTSLEPFRGDSIFNVVFQIMHDDPIPPRRINSEIPADLQAICLKCLQKNPKKRYSSMKFLARDLKNFLQLKPIAAKPPGKIELAYKLFLRNKATSITLVGSLLVIFVLTFYYVNSLHRALNIEKKAIKALTKAREETKKATFAKNRITLNAYYKAVQLEVRENNFSAAQKSLDELREHYLETKFSDAQRYLEYRYLAKSTLPYEKKLSANISKNIEIYHLKDSVLTIAKKGIISLHRQKLTSLHKYKKVNCGYDVYSSSLSPDQRYLTVLYSDKNRKVYLGVYYTKTLEIVAERTLKDSFTKNNTLCKFYTKNIIITAGKYINVWRINKNTLRKEFKIEQHSRGLIAGGANRVTSLDINVINKEFIFVFNGFLYKYSFDRKKIEKINVKHNTFLVYCVYDKEKNAIVATTKDKIFSLTNKIFLEFKNPESAEVKKIISHKSYVIGSTKEGILYIWKKNGALWRKITTDQNSLYSFSVRNMNIFVANDENIFVYSVLGKNILHQKLRETAKYVSLVGKNFTYNNTPQVVTKNLLSFQRKSEGFKSRTLYSFLVPESNKICTLLHLPQTRNDIVYDGLIFRDVYLREGKHKFFNVAIKGIFYDQKRKKLFAYNDRGVVTIWDLKKKILLSEISPPEWGDSKMQVATAGLSPDGLYMAFAVHHYGYITILDLRTKKYLRVTDVKDATDNTKIKFAILRGKTYLFMTVGNSILIYDFNDLKREKRKIVLLNKYKDPISSFAVVEDEERLITTDRTGRVLVWDLMDLSQKNSDRFLLQLEKKSEMINDCVYNKELKKLVTVGSDVRIWSFD